MMFLLKEKSQDDVCLFSGCARCIYTKTKCSCVKFCQLHRLLKFCPVELGIGMKMVKMEKKNHYYAKCLEKLITIIFN